MNRNSTLIRLLVGLAVSVTVSAGLVSLAGPMPQWLFIIIISFLSAALVFPYFKHRIANIALTQSDIVIERLSRQVDLLNQAAIVSETDINGVITHVNQMFCDVSKYEREELVGKTHNIINSGYHSSAFWVDYWDTISNGGIWRGEICNRAKDGSIYWVYSTVTPIYDLEGEIVGYNSVRVNITDSKLAEQKELERQRRTLRYNETLTSLIRHPKFINQEYEELLDVITQTVSNTLGVQRVSIWTYEAGQDKQSIHLVNLWDYLEQKHYRDQVLTSDDFPGYFQALDQQRVLIYDDVYKNAEVEEFTKDYFPSNNIVSMMDAPFYRSGKLAGVICLEQVDTFRHWLLEDQSFIISIADILTIIYESKRLHNVEESLRHSEKLEALGKLTGGIAHDFNNMLGVIMGYSELLVNALDDNPKLLQFANQIQTASKRGAKLTSNLLSFSRRKQMHEEEVKLPEFLDEQLELIQKSLTVSINIKYDFSEEIWPVWLDKSDLEHALLNMCINAMHAMSEIRKPELTVTLSNRHTDDMSELNSVLREGEYVQLEFIDNGTGISDEVLPKIFEPFYSTKGDDGTGLGLAQVYSFLSRCHGTVTVDTVLDKGTTFRLYFPRHYPQTSFEFDDAGNQDEKMQGSEHILIVDDELPLCYMTAEILANLGYTTHCSESASDALEYLSSNQVDLVLSDIIMPNMDGYQLSQEILEKYPDIKIQLMSGFADTKDSSEVSEKLAGTIIRKPFVPTELVEKIRALLDE